MLTITEVKYRTNHVEITLDAGEPLRLPLTISSQYRLNKDRTVSDEEYRQLREESERFLCREKALDYLSIKNRTTHEVEKYLAKKGFSAKFIRETLAGLANAGYLDDLKYARSYIQARQKAKLVGKNLLKKELYGRGVPRELVQKAFNDADQPGIDPEAVFRLAEKKFKSLEGKKNRLHKVSYFLGQRGFDYEIIQGVIRRLRDTTDTEEGASDA